MTPAEFCTDSKTIDAVVRNLIVIGEASRHIPESIEQRHPEVPWRTMRGIRNVVVHEYFGVARRSYGRPPGTIYLHCFPS